MRAERMFLLRNAQSCHFFIHDVGKQCELRACCNPSPEDPGGLRTRKKSVAAKLNFECADREILQCLPDLFDRLFWLLTDEFKCDVQRFGARPTSVGNESTDAFHEAFDSLADGIVDVEGNKEAHEILSWPL